MLSVCQPLALWLVFVMEASDLGAVWHVWQQMLPVQQAAGSSETRAALRVQILLLPTLMGYLVSLA